MDVATSSDPTSMTGHCDTPNADNSTWDVLVLLNFPHFSPESAQTGSLGATESKV